MLLNDIFRIFSVILAIWGLLITLLFISNSSMKNVLSETNRLMKNVRIDQIKLKKPSNNYLFFKRLTDICFCVVSLPTLLPLFLLTGILIKIDSRGPILQTTKRIGLNGQTFNSFKFRTMYTHKDEEHHESVTAVGRFLRKAALDEVPLIINVLRGDMSLVGRSQILDFTNVATIITPEMYNDLLAIKPGIVSLWSISYDKIKHNTESLLLHDLVYISKMSFLFDLKILLSTTVVALGKAGAY